MARSKSSGVTQTKALLIRSYHWQRRQYCTLFCNFLIPPIALILFSVLDRSLTPPVDTPTTSFGQNPKGAFAPRPFNPNACNNSRSEQDVRTCIADPLQPKFSISVYADSSFADQIGSKNPASPSQDSGILSAYSLNPFAYIPALDPSYDFFESQTEYDAVLLHTNFFGQVENPIFQTVNQTAISFTADSDYQTTATVTTSREGFMSGLYDSWYEGGPFISYASAIAFDKFSATDQSVSLDVTMFFNISSESNCTVECPLVSNVVRTYAAIYNQLFSGAFFVYLRRMPYVGMFEPTQIVSLIVSIIIALLQHFLLPVFLRFIVLERVGRMRSMMLSMGLGRARYWIGTYLSLLIFYILKSALTIIIGFAVKIPFFTENTPVSYIVLFFMWGNVLIALSFFLAPFFKDPETAQTLAWLYIILVSLIGGPYLGARLSNDNVGEGTWSAIMLLPSFAFMRSVYYAGAYNAGGEGLTLTPKTVYTDVQLGMCAGGGPFCRSYLFLAGEWIFLIVFALYFDRVLPTAGGARAHPLFFLGLKRGASYNDSNEKPDDLDGTNVKEEALHSKEIVDNMANNPFDGVVLDRLSVTFPGKPPVHAVSDMSLMAKRNEVLCIMAHNGAGKTTMFRTLIGELEPTSGNAFVNGNSILSDIDKVQRSMGVAPQHDILWEQLTVQEHLFFYGRVKNMSGAELKQAVSESLQAVQLDFARKRKVNKLSGGMKRRLSVSLAMIGKPSFILLDEPSTGLDINSRQKLWESINRMRQDKVVILTTHSLEEAEALSTRVAIMSQGQLKCIGTSDELKFQLGKGHRLTIQVPVPKVADVHEAVMAIAPGAVVETLIGGSIEYVLPREIPVQTVLAMIAEKKDMLSIQDWSIHQSSLEDVFLKMTRDNMNKDSAQLAADIEAQ